jgi:RNA polymerase sigma-32 factor
LLNSPISDDGEANEWMDCLVDDSPSQERLLTDSEDSDNRDVMPISVLDVLNEREKRFFETRRLAYDRSDDLYYHLLSGSTSALGH